MVGIYKIENKNTHQVYIGQSMDIQRRLSAHRSRTTSTQYVDVEIQQYGVDQFSFEILEECAPEQLDEREQYYIQSYDSYNNGYNRTKGGCGTLGKCVKLTEIDIYEIYQLLLNSTRSQNDIAQLFHVGQDTISEINHGKTRRLSGYSFPLRMNKNIEETIKPTPIAHILTEELLLQEFKQLHSFTAIGNKYGVSHTQIQRIALKYGWTSRSLKQHFTQPPQTQKQVLQFSKDGRFIREFSSTSEACATMHDEHIKQVCDGKRKSSRGYVYKYK